MEGKLALSNANDLELHMLVLINGERTSRGLDTLALEQNLNRSAELHSDWMLATGAFSHTGQGGSTPTDRMRDASFDFSGTWQTAENIAWQSDRGAPGYFDDVTDLHVALMNSPGHRANLLDPDLELIGIGISTGNFAYASGTFSSVMVTQNFATTAGNVDLDPGFLGASGADLPDSATDDETFDGGAVNDVFVVARLYEAGLDRDGALDRAGLNYWIDVHEGGISFESIAQSFLNSPEFTDAFGAIDFLTTDQYVDRLYLNVLDRPGEQEGVDFWVNNIELGLISEANVLFEFAVSPENEAATVYIEELQEVSTGEWWFA